METFEGVGIHLERLPFKMTYVRDLEVLEHAILREVITDDGTVVLGKLCTADRDAIRYLIFEGDPTLIEAYLEKKVSLLGLMTSQAHQFFAVDFVRGGTITKVVQLTQEEVPFRYWPNSDVFHDETLRPGYGDDDTV